MIRSRLPLLLLLLGAAGCGDSSSPPLPTADPPTRTSQGTQDAIHETRSILKALANFVDRYAEEHDGSLPGALDDLLRVGPDGAPMIGALPLDAWGRPLRFSPRGDGSFELRSAGVDGTMDTADDVVLGD